MRSGEGERRSGQQRFYRLWTGPHRPPTWLPLCHSPTAPHHWAAPHSTVWNHRADSMVEEPSGAGQVMADDLWPGQLQPAPFICSSLQHAPTRAGSCTGACMFVILSLHSFRLDFSAQLLMLTDSNGTVRLVANNYIKIKWKAEPPFPTPKTSSSRSSPHTKDKIVKKHQWQQAPIMACSAVPRLARACSWARFMSWGEDVMRTNIRTDLHFTWAQNSSFPLCSMSLVTTFLMALSTVTGGCVHFSVWIFWNLSMHKKISPTFPVFRMQNRSRSTRSSASCSPCL